MLGHYPTAGSPISGTSAAAVTSRTGSGSTGAATSSAGAISVASFATTVTFSVVDASGIAMADTSGLDYAFFDQPRISNALAPVKKGTTFAISGGVATISIAGVTALFPGGTGRIEWGDAAGTKHGGGQIAVS